MADNREALLRQQVNEVEDAVAQGHYDAAQTFTKMRELFNAALRAPAPAAGPPQTEEK